MLDEQHEKIRMNGLVVSCAILVANRDENIQQFKVRVVLETIKGLI